MNNPLHAAVSGCVLWGLAACGGEAPAPAELPVRVDPRIGSGGQGFAVGSAFVGAAAPHGLVKAGPDTSGPVFGTLRFLHCAGYWADDDTILGFSQLHAHGTGLPDYGVLRVMPLTAAPGATLNRAATASKFDKESEVAEMGYYAVTLDNGHIRTEITASPRVAHYRIAYPSSASRGDLLVDLGATLVDGKVDDAEVQVMNGEVTGRVHTSGSMSSSYGGFDAFFVLRSRGAISHASVFAAGATTGSEAAHASDVSVVLSYDGLVAPIELQIGMSYTSVGEARKNLEAEASAFDFDGTRQATLAAWNERIHRVTTTGGTNREQRIFLSSMYHLFLMPSIVSDADGTYLGMDGTVHVADGFRYVSDLSMWDTYRTLHPLYDLIAHDSARDAVRSLVVMAEQHGTYPKWPLAIGETGTMLGSSAEVVLADAYARGVTDFPAEEAYALARAAAMDVTAPAGGRGGRSDVGGYMENGYVDLSRGRSVSITTEYSYDDFALAQLARALGHDADADALALRSQSWRNLWDPSVGFLRARRATGQFEQLSFDPIAFTEGYAEANAWQTVFAPAHDVDGLATLMGGREQLVAKLQTFFESAETDLAGIKDVVTAALERPYYWGGNEPDIHVPYTFAQAGRPDLTQKWARWAATKLYGDGTNGLPGNDDGGTLGAWYVFTAMGLYPLPGTDRFIIGAPLFPRVDVAVEGGTFTILAPDSSAERPYVQAVTLDGVAVTQPELRQSDLRAGHTLRFEMGALPSTWGR